MPAGALTAAAVVAAQPPGWYGKLSMLGDFAHRRLPEAFVRHVDAWLSAWIVESRRELGETWLGLYLTAPVLRFAWAPGIAGPCWWFGVLMPSCDAAGRYFPLLVAQALDAVPTGDAVFDRLGMWFEHVAHAATATLDDDATVDAFEAALEGAPASRGVTTAAAAGKQGGAWAEAIRLIALSGGSAWWHHGDLPEPADHPAVEAMLPDARTLTRLLFDGGAPRPAVRPGGATC